MELAYGTDPWDKSSVNEPPSQLFSSQTLQIYENLPVGTLIGRVEGTDPQWGIHPGILNATGLPKRY